MSFELFTYINFAVIASIIVFAGSYWQLSKNKYPSKIIWTILLSSLITTWLGARTLNFFTNNSNYEGNYWNIFDLNLNGYSLYGGLFLSLLTILVLAKLFKIKFWELADNIAPFAGIGIAIAKTGCMVHGCCFGKETNLPWAIRPPIFSPTHIYQINNGSGQLLVVNPVHPTQMYEVLSALFSSLIAFYLIRKKVKTGLSSLVFTIIFTILRWIIYYFRALPESFIMPVYFYPIMYLGVIFGSGVMIKNIINSKTVK